MEVVNKIKKMLNGESVRYIIVGCFTTLVNLVVFAFFCKFLHVDVNVSNIISIIIAILFAYVTNKIFVFKSHCDSTKELCFEFLKFVSARLLTMILEVGGVYILFTLCYCDEMIAKFMTQILVLIGNFFISKFLVFANKEVK